MAVQKVVLKDKNDNYLFPYTDNTKNVVETMGTASILNLGVTVLFLGETDSNYTKGHIYTCVGADSVYSWQDVTPGLAPTPFNLVSDGLLARWKFEDDILDSSASPVTTANGYMGGTTWTARTSSFSGVSNAPYSYFSFLWGNGLLFHFGANAKHNYSSDGINWASTGENYTSFSFANGKFWKFFSGSYYNSDDGLTWNEQANFGKVGSDFGSSVVTYFQDKYILLDTPTSSDYSTKIFISSDGSNWSILSNKIGTSNVGNLFRIQVENNILFIHDFDNCKTFYTSDLVTFSEISWDAYHPYKIVYGNGIYIIFHSTGFGKKSVDLSTWTTATFGGGATCFDLTFDGGCFVSIVNDTAQIYNSVDGSTWTNRTQVLTSLKYVFAVQDLGLVIASSVTNSGNKICTSPSSVCFPFDSTLDKKVGYFSGSAYLTFTPTSFPAGSSPITMGGWFYTAQGLTETFIAYGTSTTYRAMAFASNALATYYYTTVQNNSYYNVGNIWTHWVITYDGLNLRIYINGENIITVKAPTTWNTAATLGRIGSNLSNTGIFKGYMSDIRVYDRPLKSDEVKKWFDGLG